jgi:hypothetical protein
VRTVRYRFLASVPFINAGRPCNSSSDDDGIFPACSCRVLKSEDDEDTANEATYSGRGASNTTINMA